MSTITPELQQQLQIAYEAIPEAHRHGPPVHKSVVESSAVALKHLNDYAFTQGYAYVKQTGSFTAGRHIFVCIHYGDKTRNYRKTNLRDKKRAEGKVNHLSCKVYYIANIHKERGGQLIFGHGQH
ncbi:hypothetical protein IFR05_016436, partial [Cadophora sp. M221]